MKIKSIIAASALLSSLVLVGCASTPHHESTGQYIDSSALTLKVKTKLLEDKKVKSLPITVNTYDNVVQLSGFVDTQYQKDRAERIARSVEGVTSVKDNLVVKPR